MSEDMTTFVVIDETQYVYGSFQDLQVTYAFTNALRRMSKAHSYSIVFEDEQGEWVRVEVMKNDYIIETSPFSWQKRKSD